MQRGKVITLVVFSFFVLSFVVATEFKVTDGTNTIFQVLKGGTINVSGDMKFNESDITGVGHLNVSTVNISTTMKIPCIDGEYIDGNGNCKDINTTIDERTNSTIYLPFNYTIDEGTYTSGNLTSIREVEEGFALNVSEDVGAAPLLITINFTNVTSFDTVIGRIYYDGGNGHEMQLEIRRTDTGEWENYEEYTDMTDYVNIHIPIFDSENHITGGDVAIRFDHYQNGLPGHEFSIDYIALVEGWTALTTAKHDGLGGRDNKENHPWAVPTDGSRQMDRLNVTGNIYHSQNITSINSSWGYFNNGSCIVIGNLKYVSEC